MDVLTTITHSAKRPNMYNIDKSAESHQQFTHDIHLAAL